MVERQDVLVAVLVATLRPLALLPAVQVLALLLLERLELLPKAGVVAVRGAVLLLWGGTRVSRLAGTVQVPGGAAGVVMSANSVRLFDIKANNANEKQ